MGDGKGESKGKEKKGGCGGQVSRLDFADSHATPASGDDAKAAAAERLLAALTTSSISQGEGCGEAQARPRRLDFARGPEASTARPPTGARRWTQACSRTASRWRRGLGWLC